MKQKQSLTVLHGGKFARVPRALAIGGAACGFTSAERDVIARAGAGGLQIIVFTDLDEERAAVEFGDVDDLALVVPCDSRLMPGPPLTRRAARVEALTTVLQGWGMGLDDVAVIGAEPIDRDMLMVAGVPIALEGAGYDALSVADLVFPARAAGGLIRAIEASCALASNIASPTTRPHGRG